MQARLNCRTHWKLSAANNVSTGEDQNLASQLVSDVTHCPDTRKRLPREWLIRRWLKPLTRQAPKHLLTNPMPKHPDEDCYCYDPTLPHKLSWGCLYPRCEEKPEPLCLVFLRTPRCSSRMILLNWCNETKPEVTTHWDWWTKTRN